MKRDDEYNPLSPSRYLMAFWNIKSFEEVVFMPWAICEEAAVLKNNDNEIFSSFS